MSWQKLIKHCAIKRFKGHTRSLVLLLILLIQVGCGASAGSDVPLPPAKALPSTATAPATVTRQPVMRATQTGPGLATRTRLAPSTTVASRQGRATPTVQLSPLATPRPTVSQHAGRAPIVSPPPTTTLWFPLIVAPAPALTATALLTVTASASISAATPSLSPTPDGVARTAQVPILMYHYLSEPPANANRIRLDLSVTPALFSAHLDRIVAEGYTTISLYDLTAHLAQGAPLPAKPLILTFDDGYRDNYANAFPLLVQRNMQATFFVITDFMDAQRPEYLTWPMARRMLAAGMAIESHSRNHASLRERANDYLVWQALGSLETIEYELGVRPRFISYPAGEYDAATLALFQSANYWAGVTTVQGATQRSDHPFELQRIRVRGTTTPEELARLLALDW